MRLHDEQRIRRMTATLKQMTPKARGEAADVLERMVRASTAARVGNGDGDAAVPLSSTSKVLP
jgi:hypothetical protein